LEIYDNVPALLLVQPRQAQDSRFQSPLVAILKDDTQSSAKLFRQVMFELFLCCATLRNSDR
jgi:hypothetical protein